MTNVVLMVSTHRETAEPKFGSSQPISVSLPEGAVLGMLDEESGRWAPLLTEKPGPRARTTDWSVLDS